MIHVLEPNLFILKWNSLVVNIIGQYLRFRYVVLVFLVRDSHSGERQPLVSTGHDLFLLPFKNRTTLLLGVSAGLVTPAPDLSPDPVLQLPVTIFSSGQRSEKKHVYVTPNHFLRQACPEFSSMLPKLSRRCCGWTSSLGSRDKSHVLRMVPQCLAVRLTGVAYLFSDCFWEERVGKRSAPRYTFHACIGRLLSLVWAALESGGINHCRVRMMSQGQRKREIQEWQINVRPLVPLFMTFPVQWK